MCFVLPKHLQYRGSIYARYQSRYSAIQRVSRMHKRGCMMHADYSAYGEDSRLIVDLLRYDNFVVL